MIVTESKAKKGKVKIMESFTSFGKFIEAKRVAHGISLRKMAQILDVSAPFWSDVEKDRKLPPKLDKLEQLASILHLTDEDKTLMLDLAGKQRNTVAPDIPEYIKGNDYLVAALRTARDLGANEEDWEKFVEELKQRKG